MLSLLHYCNICKFIIFFLSRSGIMNEVADNFAWTRQLECPPTVYNDSVKKMFVHYFSLLICWNSCLLPCLTFSFHQIVQRNTGAPVGRYF